MSVTVPHEPPKVVVESASQTVMEDEAVMFRCNASGIPTPNITWERLGSSLPGDSQHQNGLLTIASVRPKDAGTYVCKAVNSEGEDSFNVRLVVRGEVEMLYSTQEYKQNRRHALLAQHSIGLNTQSSLVFTILFLSCLLAFDLNIVLYRDSHVSFIRLLICCLRYFLYLFVFVLFRVFRQS